MGKKIIGTTVGTPISPAKIEEKISPVKTVNNVSPDAKGNVSVSVPNDVLAQINNAQTAANNAQSAANTKAPMYTYGTDDLEAGVSSLETGKLHFVYE